MKFFSATLIAAALLAGGAAQAGSQTYAVGTPESGLVGTSTFEFSPLANQVLNGGAGISARFYKVEPGALTLKPSGKFVQASFPVQSITLDDGVGGPTAAEPQILALSSLGGMRMDFEGDGWAIPNSALQITGLRADLSTKQIYASRASATAYGGGNLREVFNVPLWNFSTLTSQLNLPLLANPSSSAGVVAQIELTGLTFTPEALALLAHVEWYESNLLDEKMSQLTDVGKFTAVIHAIPEPSTFVLTGLGLALMGLVAQRRRAHH